MLDGAGSGLLLHSTPLRASLGGWAAREAAESLDDGLEALEWVVGRFLVYQEAADGTRQQVLLKVRK